jgi:hypothetical protein
VQDCIEIFGIVRNGTMVLFEIPTIEPSEVFTSRSKRVRITNPTFQGLDVFFREMLVEHWCRWFDEAECIVKIVAQMFRVLSWWSFQKCKDVVDSNTKLSREILVILSRRNSRAPLACHGWSRIFFKIAEEI